MEYPILLCKNEKKGKKFTCNRNSLSYRQFTLTLKEDNELAKTKSQLYLCAQMLKDARVMTWNCRSSFTWRLRFLRSRFIRILFLTTSVPAVNHCLNLVIATLLLCLMNAVILMCICCSFQNILESSWVEFSCKAHFTEKLTF